MTTPRSLSVDLACAILRIEQAYEEPEMRDFLIFRLMTCDVPRLRGYLSDAQLEDMDEFRSWVK